jgi:O-antigen ligase
LERSRLFIWRKDFQDYLNASPLFGCGVGCAARSEDAILRLQADNQYLRMLKENGIFGLLIWLFGLFTCWRLMFGGLRRIYAVFLVSFLLAGMTQEVFLLSKGGQVFWIITGLLLGFSLSQGNGTRAEESAMIRGCRPKGIAV